NWIANIPIEQADNAKRIHVLPDPWTHRWIAIVPEGLPRYWLIDASASSDSEPVDAAQYDLVENETPIAFTWTVKDNAPSLTIGTSSLKIRNLDPQSGKAILGEAGAIASMVPSINDRGEVLGWNAITMTGEIREVENLRSSSSNSSDESGTPQLKNLPFSAHPSEWVWGRHHSHGLMLGMAQLPSGETGTVLQSRLFSPILRHPLSVRPEQCKIHSIATLSNDSLCWLSTAPNRVLHLQTADGNVADQMSLGKRIISAGLFPDQKNMRVIIAIEKEVNCWSIEPMVVNSPPVPASVPAPNNREAISPSEQPGA
ncbi:MAG TPA: hypothetical protein VM260_01640, partial [Pirellula sp.]|nr:hypothetical protein [Pirellula sp.]